MCPKNVKQNGHKISAYQRYWDKVIVQSDEPDHGVFCVYSTKRAYYGTGQEEPCYDLDQWRLIRVCDKRRVVGVHPWMPLCTNCALRSYVFCRG